MAAMRMNLLLCSALALPMLAQQPVATTGRITVYTPGSIWKGSAKRAATVGIGKNDFASQGFVFDGGTKLAKLMTGKFITLNLPAGHHDIGVNQSPKGPSADATVGIDVEPRKSYFLRLTTTSKGAWIVQAIYDHLELVPCAEAREEADGTKPIPVRLVDKSARSLLVDGTYFPQCE